MTRVLFVVNSFSTGGISSSLKSVLSSRLNHRFSFSVFSITRTGDYIQEFNRWNIGENFWTTASRANRNAVQKRQLLITICLRIAIGLASFVGLDLRSLIDKRTIRKIERKYSFDKVVAFSEGAPLDFVAKFKNPNRIAWIHCDYIRRVKDRTAEEEIFRCFETIVCVSKYTQSSFATIFPNLKNRTTHIYNLLDIERICQLSQETVDLSLFQHDRFVVISVGRISEVKRFGHIPHIAHILKDRGLSFYWYIIGPKVEIDAYNDLVYNIENEGVNDMVRLLGGIINPYPYFKVADLLVSLSSSEACPMVFNEAKVMNLPIVSTDFGSAFEFINDRVDGVIRPIDDVATAIQQIYNGEIVFHHNPSRLEKYNTDILNDIIRLLNSECNVGHDE